MNDEAHRHLRRAFRLLSSVETRVESDLPEVTAHTAYYAMFHAAIAALAGRNVPPPKTHTGVVARFGQEFRNATPDFRDQIARLRRGLDRRLIADYDADDVLTIVHARDARDDAVGFVAFCARLLGPS